MGAVDIGLWDLRARAAGLSPAELIGKHRQRGLTGRVTRAPGLPGIYTIAGLAIRMPCLAPRAWHQLYREHVW